MEEFNSSSSDEGRNCRRGHWRPAEDDKLRQLVQQFGPRNWNSIAENIQGRTGKSCRLRWFNQLDPRINRKPFSEEEEERLLLSHKKYGNKWSLISRLFPGRTDNAVKNHYHVVIARQRRERPITHNQGSFHDYPMNLEVAHHHQYLKLRSPSKRSELSISSMHNNFPRTYNGLFNLEPSPHSSHFNKRVCNFGGTATTSCPFKSNVVDHHSSSFGFSNLGIGCYGTQQKKISRFDEYHSSSSTNSKYQMDSQILEQARDDESSQHKDDDVHFIDFLGVGVS